MGSGGVFGRGVLYLLLDVVFEDMETLGLWEAERGEGVVAPTTLGVFVGDTNED